MKYQQSKNWTESKNIDWFIENASFVFTNKGYKGQRPRIVTKEKLNGMNCFEFDNDRYGIIIVSCCEFRVYWEGLIDQESTEVIPILNLFLEEWGAGSFVNPKGLRSFINRLKGNCKIIEVNSSTKTSNIQHPTSNA